MSEKVMTLPLIPLRGISIFPNMIIHFDVGREKSRAAINPAMENQTEIFLSTQKDYEIEDPEFDDIYEIGTICRIKQIIKLPNDVIRILVEGIDRGRLTNLITNDEYLEGEIEKIDEPSNEEYEGIEAYVNLLKKSFNKYIKSAGNTRNNVMSIFDTIKNYSELADVVASYIIIDEEKRQEILQEINCIKRIEKLLIIIEKEIDILNIEKKIGKKLKENVDKSQREYYIREQIRVLQEEIGEDDEDKKEIRKYEEKIRKSKLPKYVREKAENELSRLKTAAGQGSESNVIRTYLDWILDIPWSKSTKDNFDIKEAEEILNNDHYGLEEVKERIVEYLAVKQYTNSLKGPILCLVGPPGVGKTSIAKSIANATNRK